MNKFHNMEFAAPTSIGFELVATMLKTVKLFVKRGPFFNLSWRLVFDSNAFVAKQGSDVCIRGYVSRVGCE